MEKYCKKTLFFIFVILLSNTFLANYSLSKEQKKTTKQSKNKSSQSSSLIRTGDDTDGIPDFPNEKEVYYEQLFDDGFTNNVESYPVMSEYGDNFIGNNASKKLNKMYIAGNDNNISQMDAIEAEKVNFVDGVKIDKDLVGTERTRVMAYLTQNQMIIDEFFETPRHSYFLSAITNEEFR